ncbi:unnamed protein product [Rhodiola kirilowii]
MRPRSETETRARTSPVRTRPEYPTSRSPTRSKLSPRASLVADRESVVGEDFNGWDYPNPNPRSFPHIVKQQCWEKAEKIKRRDPERWRRDPLGNVVFRKLVGCAGCLCHDYDHIQPYSKGGQSTLDNCQVLQTRVNRSKGNRTDHSRAELIQKSSYCRVSGRDMDLLELSAYGNVQHENEKDQRGGCRIQ